MTLPALRPMLAVAGSLPAVESGWAFEMKWDGLRSLAFLENEVIRLTSRTGRDITSGYPELAPLGRVIGARPTILDGEIVAFGDDSWPSFEALQQRMNVGSPSQVSEVASRIPVSYVIFDLLWAEGEPTLDEPYRRRRERLESLELHGPNWQTPPSFGDGADGSGPELLALSRRKSLEGIMAKRTNSRYEPGRRSPAWRKIKNVYRQEVVVGGIHPGEGTRAGQIGSLLIGVHGPAGLEYAGHVGTGFDERALDLLERRLVPLRTDASPFATTVPPEHSRTAVWVRPQLVIQVAFAGWTSAGRMRAAAYKGLRDDKPAADVVREPAPSIDHRPGAR